MVINRKGFPCKIPKCTIKFTTITPTKSQTKIQQIYNKELQQSGALYQLTAQGNKNRLHKGVLGQLDYYVGKIILLHIIHKKKS